MPTSGFAQLYEDLVNWRGRCQRKPLQSLTERSPDVLAGKPICAGIDTSGFAATPLTEAKRQSAAEFERCYLVSVMGACWWIKSPKVRGSQASIGPTSDGCYSVTVKSARSHP